ncbi:tRNA (cytosine(38)-C(5))-methyltransferase-like [Ruditapes philippinarum]|uniref:tRNA (cytosine(38)-C(5))-methyltransferase-like n=1 Tax=Ruditapes philippinarum TaxID=129788 RepID=UPI00295C0667|nr:tRNA (cytosine(38)-C(5))-methyltransferase-like [Ruditapes philippinarum]
MGHDRTIPIETKMAAPISRIKVLELYSGIGGMHFALCESGKEFKVVMAMDVNTNANLVYRHNFPNVDINASAIETLTKQKFDSLGIDMILMSPPCQPFTRVGKQQDTKDVRTRSFLHILELLKKSDKCPSYILVENVKGFESSESRMRLIQTLTQCNYKFQEFLLTPLQFGIPNSRLRYFLIAKKKPLQFCFEPTEEIKDKLPNCPNDWLTYKLKSESLRLSTDSENNCCPCRRKAENSTVQTETGSTGQNSCKRVNADCGTNFINKRHKQELGSNISSEEEKKDNFQSDDSDKCITPKGESEGHVTDRKTLDQETKETKTFSTDNLDCLQNYGKNLRQLMTDDQADYVPCLDLYNFLEDRYFTQNLFEEYQLLEKDLKRFMSMDIVNPCSQKTCCFTKRYGHYIDGAGSLIMMTSDTQDIHKASALKERTILEQNKDQWKETEYQVLRNLKLRYFTPREIGNILCFPAWFGFPDRLTNRQKYMLLGNSLNVHMVSLLIKLMTSPSDL